MFGFISDVVESAVDVVSDAVDGEVPSKRNVSNLIAAGISVYAAAEMFGVAESVIESLIDD